MFKFLKIVVKLFFVSPETIFVDLNVSFWNFPEIFRFFNLRMSISSFAVYLKEIQNLRLASEYKSKKNVNYLIWIRLNFTFIPSKDVFCTYLQMKNEC